MEKKKLKTKQRPRDIWGKGNRPIYKFNSFKKELEKAKAYWKKRSPYEKDLEDGWNRVMASD